MKRSGQRLWLYLLLIFAVMAVYSVLTGKFGSSNRNYSYNEFQSEVNNDEIKEAVVTQNAVSYTHLTLPTKRIV